MKKLLCAAAATLIVAGAFLPGAFTVHQVHYDSGASQTLEGLSFPSVYVTEERQSPYVKAVDTRYAWPQ
jgi:hypothetical protein